MNIGELIRDGSGILLLLLTVVQIAPLQINPWSALAKLLGRAINADVIRKLDTLETAQAETRQRLEEHIRVDDERNADLHRVRILHFNTELLEDKRHTKESFNEIMFDIDCYKQYCASHPEYKNNRAVHAVANIKRVYDELLKTHGFL